MDLQALKTELDTGHPDTGAYSADAVLAADQINATNRTGAGELLELVKYLTLEKYRSNTLLDTTPLFIFGRLQMVADQPVGTDLFGSGVISTAEHITSAKSFLRILAMVDLSPNLSFFDSRINGMLNDLRDAEVIGANDKTAIEALSSNKQSRANELGLGRVTPAHVRAARQL